MAPVATWLLLSVPLLCSSERLGSRRGIFDSLINSRHKTEGAELPLVRTHEGWYSASLDLGGQAPARLVVDTGSGLMWVRSSALPAPKNTSNQWNFIASGHFSAQYGRGSVKGDVLTEHLKLQSSGSSRDCSVGRATSEEGIWSKQKTIDGVMGLGCSDGTANGALQCVLPHSDDPDAPQRVFTLQLKPEGGTLILGYVPAEYRASMYFMPPSESCGHWAVPLLSLNVREGWNAPRDQLSGTARAILDSGTDGIIGPTFAVIKLARALNATPAKAGSGYGGEVTFYTVPCTARVDLAPVTLSFGEWGSEANVTLTGEDLVRLGTTEDSQDCHLRMAGWETQEWIMGAALLQKLKGTIYYPDKNQVALSL